MIINARLVLLVDWSGDKLVLGGSLVFLVRQEWKEKMGLRAGVARIMTVMRCGGNGMICRHSSWLRRVGSDFLWDSDELCMHYVS